MSLLGVPNFGVEMAKYLEREHKKMASGVETRGSAMSARTARDVISDWIHFEASIQNGFENSRGKSVNDHADDILSALRSAGFAVVPVEPTEGMKKAWTDAAPMNNAALLVRYAALIKAAQVLSLGHPVIARFRRRRV